MREAYRKAPHVQADARIDPEFLANVGDQRPEGGHVVSPEHADHDGRWDLIGVGAAHGCGGGAKRSCTAESVGTGRFAEHLIELCCKQLMHVYAGEAFTIEYAAAMINRRSTPRMNYSISSQCRV